jgi:hypothetical protein
MIYRIQKRQATTCLFQQYIVVCIHKENQSWSHQSILANEDVYSFKANLKNPSEKNTTTY